MDWNRIGRNWKQLKGNVKEQWGKLTDDELDVINGKREQLEGKLQEHYGYAKDEAKKRIDDWYRRADRMWAPNIKGRMVLRPFFVRVLYVAAA